MRCNIFIFQVNSIAFSHDHTNKLGNNYFVTAHLRRVQFWYYNSLGKDNSRVCGIRMKLVSHFYSILLQKTSTVVLKARSAILGDLQDNHFVGVVCGSGTLSKNTYALTRSGRLCLFDNNRVLDKFTEVKV